LIQGKATLVDNLWVHLSLGRSQDAPLSCPGETRRGLAAQPELLEAQTFHDLGVHPEDELSHVSDGIRRHAH